MKHEMLSSSSSSSSGDENDDEHQFTINEHFARAYEYRKEREELSKLKDKYGSDGEGDVDVDEETDSEEDESEDEDGEELTPAVDAAILRTLARIKKRDPGIYEAGRNVYDEEHQKSGQASIPAPKPKEKASKPILLHQHRLAAELDARSCSPSPAPELEPTYTEAQAHLRAETIAAFHEPDAVDELFTLREQTQDERAREAEEYRLYLEREVGGLEGLVEVEPAEVKVEVGEEEAEVKGKKDKKDKKKKGKEKKGATEEIKQSDQEFLMNYILNRGWIDRSSKRVPTFEEVTRGPAPAAPTPGASAPAGLLDDDEFDDVADAFESSYNFRFEEPDASHIPSFPRAVPSVRRPAAHTERRKEARERRRERKEEEMRLRREEVGRLKGLRMREMQAKLERVAKEGGWKATKALETLDVEGDWDPAAYDAQMAAILKEVEGDAEADEKPMWDDDIDIGDIHVSDDDAPGPSTSSKKKDKKKDKKKAKKQEREQEGVDVDAMDADVAGDAGDEEEWDGTEEMRKRVLDKYVDELYGLEFNDMVGDLPTRFHYTPVVKETFALTPAEVLLATDKELNEYVGLRQYAPYREKVRWDAKRGERLREIKQKVGTRAQELGAELEEKQERGTKKRKGKKERMKERVAKVGLEEDADVEMADGAKVAKKAVVPEEAKEGATKKKKRALEEDAAQDGIPANGDDAEPSKKKRRRQKKTGKGHDVEAES